MASGQRPPIAVVFTEERLIILGFYGIKPPNHEITLTPSDDPDKVSELVPAELGTIIGRVLPRVEAITISTGTDGRCWLNIKCRRQSTLLAASGEPHWTMLLQVINSWRVGLAQERPLEASPLEWRHIFLQVGEQSTRGSRTATLNSLLATEAVAAVTALLPNA